MTGWTRVPGLFREHEIGTVVGCEPLNDWRIRASGRKVDGSTAYEVWWRRSEDLDRRGSERRAAIAGCTAAAEAKR